MQAILNAVDKVDPHLEHGGVFALEASFLHVDSLLLQGNEVTILLRVEAGNFTSGEHGVDHFKESLTLDLGVRKDESHRLAQGACLLVETFNVFFELHVTVGLGKRNLEEDLLADERTQLGKRLLARAAHTDKQTISTGCVDDSANLEQMEECVVEDNQIHLLGWERLIVQVELLVDKLADSFNVGNGFIHKRCLFCKLTILIVYVFALEVGKEHVSHEEVIIEALRLAELFLSNFIENIVEYFLIIVVDQFVNECSLALVAPETNKEKLRLDLLLELRYFLNNLVLVLLRGLANTTEDTGQFTNVKLVMELGRGWQETLRYSLPSHDGGLDNVFPHVNDVLLVILGLENGLQNSAVNILN